MFPPPSRCHLVKSPHCCSSWWCKCPPVAAMCVFVSMTMIANLLANHFQSYEDIDWKFVVTFPEFSGHTEGSLRMLKRSDMSKVMSRHYFGNDFWWCKKELCKCHICHQTCWKETERTHWIFWKTYWKHNIADFVYWWLIYLQIRLKMNKVIEKGNIENVGVTAVAAGSIKQIDKGKELFTRSVVDKSSWVSPPLSRSWWRTVLMQEQLSLMSNWEIMERRLSRSRTMVMESMRTTSKDMFRTQEDTEVTSAKRPSTGVNNICKSENRDLSELSSKIVDTCDAARHVWCRQPNPTAMRKNNHYFKCSRWRKWEETRVLVRKYSFPA